MADNSNALAQARIKPGTKFYHGGHGTHHFHENDQPHLPAEDVERLVADGLLDPEPPETAESAAEPAIEALPAPEVAETHETPAAEVEHQA